MIDEEGKDLLRRMRGIGSFAVPLRESDTDELEHVINHLKNLSGEQRGAIKSIGTIPKEQWDISSELFFLLTFLIHISRCFFISALYLAFAFKKIR